MIMACPCFKSFGKDVRIRNLLCRDSSLTQKANVCKYVLNDYLESNLTLASSSARLGINQSEHDN